MDQQLIIVSKEDGALWIRINRPRKKNAVTFEMYESIIKALHDSEQDPNIALTVLTGTGDYFSSGNDFVSVMASGGGLSDRSSMRVSPFERLVYELIDHPKPLIAVVNGHDVGFTVTMLGLFDYVIATRSATFLTPFAQLGVVPEACSTFTFPLMMGYGKACHMLLFGEKVTSQWAYEANLVQSVLPDEQFSVKSREIVRKFAKLPKQTLVTSKRLLKERLREKLNAVNKRENEELTKKYESEETMELLMSKFLKSKM